MVKKELIEFENKIGDAFNKGEIKAPIHLYHNNEDIMIKILNQFKIATSCLIDLLKITEEERITA